MVCILQKRLTYNCLDCSIQASAHLVFRQYGWNWSLMLLVSTVTTDPAEPCVLMVWRYASAVSKARVGSWGTSLIKIPGWRSCVRWCVCVQNRWTVLVLDNERVCIQTHLDFIFSQGGRCLCGCVWLSPSVLLYSPVASFMGSLFRNLGCECIPTFRPISLRVGKHSTARSFWKWGSIPVFWGDCSCFLLPNNPKKSALYYIELTLQYSSKLLTLFIYQQTIANGLKPQ